MNQKKSESILRSSTLSKIIAPIINRFEDKKSIPEVKNNESLTGFFENLLEPNSQSVKSLAMNNLTIKTDAKNSLPEVSEEFDC